MATIEKVIDGRKYQIVKPAARAGMKLSGKTALMVGPLVASLGSQIKAGDSKGAIVQFASALSSVDPDKVDALFMDAIDICSLHCNSHPIFNNTDFERHFGQYPGEIFQVCLWTLTEAVSDFFPWLANFGQITEKVKEEFKSQKAGMMNIGSEDPNGPDSAASES